MAKKTTPALRTGYIGVRFTEHEKAAVEKWAKAQDLPESVCIRRALLTILRSEGFLKS